MYTYQISVHLIARLFLEMGRTAPINHTATSVEGLRISLSTDRPNSVRSRFVIEVFVPSIMLICTRPLRLVLGQYVIPYRHI